MVLLCIHENKTYKSHLWLCGLAQELNASFDKWQEEPHWMHLIKNEVENLKLLKSWTLNC